MESPVRQIFQVPELELPEVLTAEPNDPTTPSEMPTCPENPHMITSGGEDFEKAEIVTIETITESGPDVLLTGASNIEQASSIATPSDHAKEQPHIIFVDPVGTRWTFPYEDAKCWSDVKELLKSVFINTYVPKWIASSIDEEQEGPNKAFSVVKIKPEHSNILPTHWESLVSPGWEFKIEFCQDVLSAIHRPRDDSDDSNESDSDEESDGKEEADEPKPLALEEMSKIVYVVNYLTTDSDDDYVKQTTERLDSSEGMRSKIKIPDALSPNSVLEETREIYLSDKHALGAKNNVFDTIGNPIISIHSPMLLNALKAIIDFQSIPDEFFPKEYSAKSVLSDLGRARFVFPFTDLYHYRDKLLQYGKEVCETHDSEYSTVCKEHIDILIDYLYGLPEVGLRKVEELWMAKTPKTTFPFLWLLLKAGSDVYVREEGKLNAYVLESFEGGPQWNSSNERSTPYIVNVWNLNFDGQVLTRSVQSIVIPVFDDEREITSLPLFPAHFHVDKDPLNPLRQQLVDRGKRFVKMVKSPSFQEYSGPSKLQGIRTFNQARVVIDHTSQPWELSELRGEKNAHNPVESVYDVELGQRTRKAQCPCKSCEAKSPRQQIVQSRIFDDYDKIDLSSQESLTDHQYLLCWSHVYGYVLKDRAWDVLEVSGLREPKIQRDIIDTLVMKPEHNKQMIKAVCEIFGEAHTQAFSSDFVRGKGEGQILLLHGPPGTGKTLTAESVAEYTGRPLLSITAADLGHEPEALEYNLLQFFRNARKWNAIVLLDEADVYLETRSTQDLRRNSIVSIFLRALDYFQGILFLTTNRVGSFDEAFMSRIHVQIGYEPLDEDSRKQIWDGYFKKLSRNLENDGQEIRCSYDAKEFVRKSEELKALKWNGREIRNAFQTAVALACFQAKQEGDRIPELTDENIRQVVNMSQMFKNYLKAVRGNEEDLAYVARIRNDEYKSKVSLND